jgi:replicative DNA helicase
MDEQPALPHSIDAERAVLGALLLAPNLVDVVTEVLEASMFYREAHRRLFELLLQMHDARQAIEPLTVVDRVLASGEEQAFGGAAYIASLPEQVPTFENVEYYARMVQEKAVRRRLLEVAQRIGHDVHAEADVGALLDGAESAVLGVSQQRAGQDWFSFNQIAGDEWRRILALADHHGEVPGITTGFIDLDQKLSGFHESELIILAARPAMGKTALALNLARHAAVEGRKPVGIFSLEMPRGQLVVRMLCAEGRIDAQRVRTGTLRRDVDWPALSDAMEVLNQAPIFIDDSPGLTVAQVRSRARRLQAQHGELGLIVIDYLQLMQGAGGPRESREQAISSISRGLKGLAKELRVPVLSLAQLNRGVELRPDKRPQMSDLRESGAIEQDADLVLFIYRDEYYKKEESEFKGVAQIIIGKNRHGPTGDVELAFNGSFLRFDNLDRRPGSGEYL